MAEDLQSPPYPDDLMTSGGLYEQLCELRVWLNQLQDRLRDRVAPVVREHLMSFPELPTLRHWESVGVCDKYSVLQRLRSCRQAWDMLLRQFECVWDSNDAIRGQYDLAWRVHYFLNDAFTLPEHREVAGRANVEKARTEISKIFDELTNGSKSTPAVSVHPAAKLVFLDDAEFFVDA